MKSLTVYIQESLQASVSKWIKEVYETMQKLIKDKQLQPIEVDTNLLAKPEKEFKFDDFVNDRNVRKILNDDKIGFTVINQMIKMNKKYLMNGDNEIKPDCMPYWYRPESKANEAEETTKSNDNGTISPTYFVGLVMFDLNNSIVENYANIVALETSMCVKESLPVMKAILNDFSLHFLNKKGKFQGVASKPSHPKMKSNLMRLGFKPAKDNKEILLYKL